MSWYINVKAAQKVKAEQEAAAKKAQAQQQTSSAQTQTNNTNTKSSNNNIVKAKPNSFSPTGADPVGSGSIVQQTSSGQTLIKQGYVVTEKKETPQGTQITVESKANVAAKQQAAQDARKIDNAVFTGANLNFAGQQPVIKTNEQRETAIAALTVVIAPASAGAKAGKVLIDEAIGVGLSQGVKTGITAYQGGDITKSLLTPKEVLESAAFGGAASVLAPPVIGGAVKLRSYGLTKLEPLAESALGRSTRLIESSTIGKQATTVVKYDAAKLGKLLDVKETQFATGISQKVVNPVKYSGALNKAVGGVGSAKSELVTVGQRGSDLILPKGETEAAAFMRGVVKPNLSDYSKVGKTTLKLYSEKIGTSEAVTDFKLAYSNPLKNTTKGISDSVKLRAVYEKSVVAPNIIALPGKTLKSTKTLLGNARGIVSKNALADPVESLNAKAASKLQKEMFTQQSKGAIKSKLKVPKINVDISTKDLNKQIMRSLKTKRVTSKKNISNIDAEKFGAGLLKGGKVKTVEQVERRAFINTEAAELKTPSIKLSKSSLTPKAVVIQSEKAVAKSSNMVSGMPKAARLPYPGTALQMREEEEITYLTMPKGLTIVKPQLKMSTASAVKVASVVTPSFKSGLSQRISSDLSLGLGSMPTVGISPVVSQTPKTTIKQTQQTMVIPKVAFAPKVSAKSFRFTPSFSVGGGDLGGGGNATLRGKWRKVNNPVKTADAMLGSFGIKTSKGTKNALRKIERFDKQIADVGFKKAVSRKKRGRGRR